MPCRYCNGPSDAAVTAIGRGMIFVCVGCMKRRAVEMDSAELLDAASEVERLKRERRQRRN